jgi:hypothetical protein
LALDLGDPYEFLSEALTPPEPSSVTNAIVYLESLNALSIEDYDPSVGISLCESSLTHLSTEITPLGYHLATLPISPRLGKLLLYSVLLQCVNPILTIAAIITTKSPFIVAFHDRDGSAATDEAKAHFCSSQSDVLTVLAAYDSWYDLYGTFSPRRLAFSSAHEANQHQEVWCQNHCLSSNGLKLIEQMRGQFLNLLQTIGFISFSTPTSASTERPLTLETIITSVDYNLYGSDEAIIKCALCCSLSPNILSLPTYALESLPLHHFSSGLGRKADIPLTKFLSEYPMRCKRKDLPLFVHPGSLLSKCRQLDSPLLLYVEGMKTSKMYCHDLTTIPVVSLALFSGRLTCSERHETIAIDGWLKYQTNKQTMRCLFKIAELLELSFLEKVLDPSAATPSKWKEVLAVLSRVIGA